MLEHLLSPRAQPRGPWSPAAGATGGPVASPRCSPRSPRPPLRSLAAAAAAAAAAASAKGQGAAALGPREEALPAAPPNSPRSSPRASPRFSAAVSPGGGAASSGAAASSGGAASPCVQGAALARHIWELLWVDREQVLRVQVARCLRHAACGEGGVDLRGLRCFRSLLASAVEIPEDTLSNLQSKFVCFDFDGDGRLSFNEVYKLVKQHLWMHLKRHGFVAQIHIPKKTLHQAGFKTVRELGKGNQGVVLLVKDTAGRERCAKRIDKGNMTVGGLSELKDEYETLRRLSCRYTSRNFEIFQDEQHYYTIGEAYHGGDLSTLKRRATGQGIVMTEQWWRNIFRQCAEALEFLHGNALIHCDIKEPNIMLKSRDFSSPEIVLIDFGIVKAMAASGEGFVGGTPGYIPPETWEQRLWYPTGDIFCLGVCIMQLLLDLVPDGRTAGIFQSDCGSLAEVRLATLSRQPPFELLPPDMPGLASVVQRMLHKEMELRPRAPQLLRDPWFLEGLQLQQLQRGGKCSKVGSSAQLGAQGITKALYGSVLAYAGA